MQLPTGSSDITWYCVPFQYSIGDARRWCCTSAGRRLCLLSILHWRCSGLLIHGPSVLSVAPFNTPLEMRGLALPGRGNRPKRHLSILHWRCRGEERPNLVACHILTFQYSIGDAEVNRYPAERATQRSFNTPLEMLAAGMAIGTIYFAFTFQYSIGDAGAIRVAASPPPISLGFQYSIGDAGGTMIIICAPDMTQAFNTPLEMLISALTPPCTAGRRATFNTPLEMLISALTPPCTAGRRATFNTPLEMQT